MTAVALGAATVFAAGAAPGALATTAESSDAGETLATAQVISGAEDEITGSLDASAGDSVDMYRISITDPAAFSATTFYSGPSPETRVGDTELALFDSTGHLLELNDDWTYYQWGGSRQAYLPAGEYGNSFAPTSAGTYYLAVMAYSADPTTSADQNIAWGDSWVDPVTGSEVYGPQDASYVLDHWVVGGNIYEGNYTIAMTGVGSLPTLYAVGTATSLGQGDSNLYTVNRSTGQATLVAPIKVGTTQLAGITGIDFAPDGTLYAVDNVNQRLLTVNKTTGAATVVGGFGDLGGWFPDITFDKYGFLYGWSEKTPPAEPTNHDDLLRIKSDGSTGWIGEAGFDTGGTGLAVGGDGVMYVKTANWLNTVDPQTGVAGTDIGIGGPTTNSGDIVGSSMFTEFRPEGYFGNTDSGTGSTLEVVNVHTGSVTQFANDPDVWLTGVAFDTGVTTRAAGADLRPAISVAPDAQVAGRSVTFTVTVTNEGPDSANVTVTVPLPSGFSYTSDDSSGASYDSTTGDWAVGALANSASATLHIDATVNATGTLTTTATVSSDVFNPGPISDSASVHRGAVPVVTTQPQSQTKLAGSTVSFTAAASGDPTPTVQWQVLTTDEGADWTDLGVTTTTLSFTASLDKTGYAYRAVFTNSFDTATTTVATLTVRTEAGINDLVATVAKGKITLTFTPTGTPPPNRFQYQVSAKQGWVTFTDGSGFSFAAKGAKQVSVRASNDGGTTWGTAAGPVTVTK